MSLLSDPDFLIHQLRLSYLRYVDDPYGPRILSLNPGYSTNPRIIASGLADTETWPELVLPTTPTSEHGELTNGDNKKRQNSGFPGANLKYTQTIVGQNRTGGVGMRVNAKRVSSIKDSAPVTFRREEIEHSNGKRIRSDSEPTPIALTPFQGPDPHPDRPAHNTLLKRNSMDMTALEQAPTPPAAEHREVEPFMPPFARAAEMEARRKQRLRSRFASTEAQMRPIVPKKELLNPEVSDDDDLSAGEVSDLDGADLPLEGEEFSDPSDESFGPRIILDGSVSDGMLSTSNSGGLSTSRSSGATGTYDHLQPNATRVPPHPLHAIESSRFGEPSETDSAHVERGSTNAKHDVAPQRTFRSEGSYFELVVPRTRNNQSAEKKATTEQSSPIYATPHPELSQPKLSFSRVKIPPVPTAKTPSALSLILASHGSKPENPFSELYSLISSRSNPLRIPIIYPFSDHKDPVTLEVRSDATIEEVIGFALWTYWEEGFTPKLDEGDETRKRDRLSAAGWSLRITEDGEVDDDFPAEQNRLTEAKIVRRSSRVMIAKKKDTTTKSLAPPVSNVHAGSLISHAPMSASIGGGSSISQGPQQLLRVRIAEKADVQTTIPVYKTIPVKESMYLEEVLENVCRRWRIEDPKQWCLVYDMKILAPLDRTVASLQGKTELYLVKVENLSQYDIEKQQTRSTDPNASIFSGAPDAPERENNGALDFTKAYKKYTVYRKMPMLVVRHERTLAIDGDYIHIMPVSTRAFLDSMKTSSYHIKSIAGCTQSAKSSSNFKLIVTRDGGNKRYDFEAENAKAAAEIVRTIRELRNKRLERSSTVVRSRRSRPPT
ncbi:hypothetical protein Clacol_004768 [Clathrus columnatus]|uniref:Stress-activated map kinase-interacting protein 1 n=1 Tax=Clathrus columnatus TaxID=1419009 RepID=A0AAV5ABZ3_9AGAM|nr:hypothetical protein Clacol_004768 [Clathrus columnatus]